VTRVQLEGEFRLADPVASRTGEADHVNRAMENALWSCALRPTRRRILKLCDIGPGIPLWLGPYLAAHTGSMLALIWSNAY